jgi:hypothetical protein
MKKAKRDWASTGRAARRYLQFSYRTRNTWSCARRVVAKAEYMDKGPNPRFVVTNLLPREYEEQELYEKLYCARVLAPAVWSQERKESAEVLYLRA